MDAGLSIVGQHFLLLPERAAYWEEERTLFVADVHFGKSAALRAAAYPIPGGTTSASLARLTSSLARTQAQRLVVLGDLWHAREGRQAATLQAVAEWRAVHSGLDIWLVEGNHDRKSGELPGDFDCRVVEEPYAHGPFSWCHDPAVIGEGYQLAGHIHPGVLLEGKGRQSERLPCFWVRREGMVLPPFGAFTGCVAVRPTQSDRVFVVADGQVLEPRCVIA